MQARRTLNPGQKGAKKFLENYGERLIYIRYQYNDHRLKRGVIVESVIE